MKYSSVFLVLLLILSACNQSNSSEIKNDSTAGKEKLTYPFTAKYSVNWQAGDENNAVLVLNCLKKYVDGDIKGCIAYFADTAEFVGDKFHFRGSRDSLEPIIAGMRNASASVSKNFDSWMTVYYPDKKDTWVTLWYTELMTDKTGKTDSIYYTDDVLVKNGKIILYDEKQRLFPEPQKK
jgi:hypothetical protein